MKKLQLPTWTEEGPEDPLREVTVEIDSYIDLRLTNPAAKVTPDHANVYIERRPDHWIVVLGHVGTEARGYVRFMDNGQITLEQEKGFDRK